MWIKKKLRHSVAPSVSICWTFSKLKSFTSPEMFKKYFKTKNFLYRKLLWKNFRHTVAPSVVTMDYRFIITFFSVILNYIQIWNLTSLARNTLHNPPEIFSEFYHSFLKLSWNFYDALVFNKSSLRFSLILRQINPTFLYCRNQLL